MTQSLEERAGSEKLKKSILSTLGEYLNVFRYFKKSAPVTEEEVLVEDLEKIEAIEPDLSDMDIVELPAYNEPVQEPAQLQPEVEKSYEQTVKEPFAEYTDQEYMADLSEILGYAKLILAADSQPTQSGIQSGLSDGRYVKVEVKEPFWISLGFKVGDAYHHVSIDTFLGASGFSTTSFESERDMVVGKKGDKKRYLLEEAVKDTLEVVEKLSLYAEQEIQYD